MRHGYVNVARFVSTDVTFAVAVSKTRAIVSKSGGLP
jgi:hypothetical protein